MGALVHLFVSALLFLCIGLSTYKMHKRTNQTKALKNITTSVPNNKLLLLFHIHPFLYRECYSNFIRTHFYQVTIA